MPRFTLDDVTAWTQEEFEDADKDEEDRFRLLKGRLDFANRNLVHHGNITPLANFLESIIERTFDLDDKVLAVKVLEQIGFFYEHAAKNTQDIVKRERYAAQWQGAFSGIETIGTGRDAIYALGRQANASKFLATSIHDSKILFFTKHMELWEKSARQAIEINDRGHVSAGYSNAARGEVYLLVNDADDEKAHMKHCLELTKESDRFATKRWMPFQNGETLFYAFLAMGQYDDAKMQVMVLDSLAGVTRRLKQHKLRFFSEISEALSRDINHNTVLSMMENYRRYNFSENMVDSLVYNQLNYRFSRNGSRKK